MENNKKKIVIFEDSELDFTKELIGNSTLDVILMRINGYFRSSEEYISETERHCKIFNIDLFIDYRISAKIFRALYPDFFNSDDVFFINLSERGQYYAQNLAYVLGFNGCVLDPLKIAIYKDKLSMKEFLIHNNIKTKEFHVISCLNELSTWGEGYILKARNSDSCRNIFECSDIMKMSYFDFSKGYIVEKKIDFEIYEEYAADLIISSNEVLDYFVTKYPAPLIKTLNQDVLNGNICLRHLSPILQKKLEKLLAKFIKALEVNTGFIHLEFFYSNSTNDILISEFGYRLAGGRIIKNYEDAFGISYYKILINLIYDAQEKTQLQYTKDRYVGDLYLPLNNKKGQISSITDLNTIDVDGILSFKYNYNIGDSIGEIEKTSFASFGNIVLVANSEESLLDKMNYIKECFNYEVI